MKRYACCGRWLQGLACAFVLIALAAPGSAQPGYPNKPVRIIVPYGAGGIADTTMRILAEKLNERFSQQFVIENRPGAGGIVAAKAGAAAPPDGYILSLTGNHNAISRSLFKTIPYDILTEFTSISITAFFDLMLVTRAESPLKSVQDVVAFARANPGRLNIGTINPGSTQNLGAELLKVATGAKVTIVPFRTSPEMATAVLRGDVDIAFEFYAALQGPILDKKIVVLATTGATRTSYLPDVPTVLESGVPGYEVSSWNGLSAPAGTPPEIIRLLSTAIIEVLKSPDVQQKAKQFGMEARGTSPEEMTERMKRDIAKWAALIEKAGLEKQ
jgi:tripartite-type tricarboxylate transporter receptor subunit TctC